MSWVTKLLGRSPTLPSGDPDQPIILGRVPAAGDSSAGDGGTTEGIHIGAGEIQEAGPSGSDTLTQGGGFQVMKESGEHGGTEDINIGVGELQESTGPPSGLASAVGGRAELDEEPSTLVGLEVESPDGIAGSFGEGAAGLTDVPDIDAAGLDDNEIDV